MSTFSSDSLRTTQRARHVAVMMMVPVRPEMIRKAHLLNARLTKAAFGVNPREPLKYRYTERIFWMLPEIDFPGPVRYFRSVLGRGADPISSRACFSDQLRTPVRKGTLVDPPKSLGELNTQAVGGQG